jgi:hypothetical protein
MAFPYRSTALPEGFVLSEVTLAGPRGEPAALARRMAEQLARRDASQPVRERTAGSTFRNPAGFSSTGLADDVHDLKAWKLIEDAGMGVGNGEPLEQALDAAVLAPAAVQGVEDDVGLRGRQRRREIRRGVDLDDLESLSPQRSRALATRRERYLALGRMAAHQHCDAGCCPARHARLNPVPAGLMTALSGLRSRHPRALW